MGKHFISLIEKMGTKVLIGDDCWIWTAGHDGGGYPAIWWDGGTRQATRVIYEEFVGPIPDGHDLDHLCHNEAALAGLCMGGKSCPHRMCVKPTHLDPKVRRDNLLASPLTEASRLIGSGLSVG